MDEQIEKIISLAGNENRYQYFTLCIIIFLWINCNFISCVLPFIEREPIINYIDSDGIFHENVTLTNDICMDLNGRNYTVIKSFGYSWASEFNIECDSFKISAIGSFSYLGNAMGGLAFSVISKFISQKKFLIISGFCFCIVIFLCTLVNSIDYFYFLTTCAGLIGLFGECLAYSSLVLSQEIVSNKKRSLFSSLINVGYSFCGIIYALLFYFFQDWRKVLYTLIGASFISVIFIWIFIYDSPRTYINNNFNKTIEILEGIAKFNGKLEFFRESIEQDEYKKIIDLIKGSQNKIENKEQKNDKHPILNENDLTISILENENEPTKNQTTNEINRESDLTLTLLESEKPKKKINVWSIFKYPSIRYKFLILNFLWIGARASFNGVTIASKSFPGNFYINIIVLCIIESISVFVSGILIDIKKLGRKGTLLIDYILFITIFILLAFLDLNTLGSLILNYSARFCAAGIEVIYYTYTIELYPSSVRSVAFGINTTFGNAGSISAPLLLEFLLNSQFLILFAVVCAINAIFLIFLPETVGKPMVESIKELEEENNLLKGETKIIDEEEIEENKNIKNKEEKINDKNDGDNNKDDIEKNDNINNKEEKLEENINKNEENTEGKIDVNNEKEKLEKNESNEEKFEKNKNINNKEENLEDNKNINNNEEKLEKNNNNGEILEVNQNINDGDKIPEQDIDDFEGKKINNEEDGQDN